MMFLNCEWPAIDFPRRFLSAFGRTLVGRRG
jgi:hypothetical protein